MSQHLEQVVRMAIILEKKGLKTLVSSPGSRNAPIIQAFQNYTEVQILSIIDERAAAYFALGIAQQQQSPVAICCTSGTAALNYSPALAEAFYQKLPIIALTADRPAEWIDQGEGQAIHQNEVFRNFIKKSFTLKESLMNMQDRKETDHLVNNLYDQAIQPTRGPVHLNIPMEEPLYGLHMPRPSVQIQINSESYSLKLEPQLPGNLSSFKKIMILVGQMHQKDSELQDALQKLSCFPQVVVLTETTSNLIGKNILGSIDNYITGLEVDKEKDYIPELLITMGGSVISKRIKALLRRHKITEHWHISLDENAPDTYRHLSRHIKSNVTEFANVFLELLKPLDSGFSAIWLDREKQTRKKQKAFCEKAPFSDLKVYDTVFASIPENTDIQIANSAAVRYAQLFTQKPNQIFYANRGTSGIDGCTSTACGASWASGKPTCLISGDLAMLYDSNGLMHSYLSPHLRIIIINNGGGGIFRIIHGPLENMSDTQTIETRHNWDFSNIAGMFGLEYSMAENLYELNQHLDGFFLTSDRAKVLEVFTPTEKNDQVLKSYFEFVNS